ncbi:LuxR C-terminal-related transcriptional regulator [Prochlorococcus sp. ALOHA_ZT_50]|jgi:hypothetical protein|uniref:helix-turn-helix transcriptional regulator n=1 Tax=Prochlorococcus sp. ALOHA_ZT_50 TaxID=2919303 RepID=UPI00338DA1C9
MCRFLDDRFVKFSCYKGNCIFSKAQIETLYWVSKGYDRVDIANLMYVSDRTIDYHLYNIRKALIYHSGEPSANANALPIFAYKFCEVHSIVL